jgi:cell division protease FtsH
MIGFWLFIMRQMQSGGNKALSFGKSCAKLSSSSQKKVTFKDVAGVDEAKEEPRRSSSSSRSPEFQARRPHSRACCSWDRPAPARRSSRARSRVKRTSRSSPSAVRLRRDVRRRRRRRARPVRAGQEERPCIVHRRDRRGRVIAAPASAAADEREQTLNQLLVRWTGSRATRASSSSPRPTVDVLDPASFARAVSIAGSSNRPDEGAILAVHTKKIPLADDANIHVLARGSSGFSGADLANLVNEAALNAARYNQKTVRMHDFELQGQGPDGLDAVR